ncbi:MAG: NAD(P)-dependent glycerol-3-phosphate dehydrogenase [Rhizobiaceae bacterium]|nr:NAD(P)-dependent glycerol-3-phosphate dehydrogenase [Rhizobiaceae bacterium]
MSEGRNIAVLGGGAWGTALAVAAHRAGSQVRLWARDGEIVDALNAGRGNARYLPGIAIADRIEATTSLRHALAGADTVLVVTPAQSLRVVLRQIDDLVAEGMPLVLCAKGIERSTGLLLSDIAAEIMPQNPVAALSGPSFAADVARGLPTAVVVAAQDAALAAELAQALSSPRFRCYSTDDIIGVEIGGALKNVFAIAAGAVVGARLGASAQAAMVTRGFVELRRIARSFGARPETLMGLSGLGDMMLTCGSSQSRNFAYGVALGEGASRAHLPLAEGVATASIAAEIVQERGVEAPIITAVDMLLRDELTVEEAVSALMTRPLRSEDE